MVQSSLFIFWLFCFKHEGLTFNQKLFSNFERGLNGFLFRNPKNNIFFCAGLMQSEIAGGGAWNPPLPIEPWGGLGIRFREHSYLKSPVRLGVRHDCSLRIGTRGMYYPGHCLLCPGSRCSGDSDDYGGVPPVCPYPTSEVLDGAAACRSWFSNLGRTTVGCSTMQIVFNQFSHIFMCLSLAFVIFRSDGLLAFPSSCFPIVPHLLPVLSALSSRTSAQLRSARFLCTTTLR